MHSKCAGVPTAGLPNFVFPKAIYHFIPKFESYVSLSWIAVILVIMRFDLHLPAFCSAVLVFGHLYRHHV